MNYYLAPMEGLTTYIYRTIHAHYFGPMDKYFTPFIASRKMNRRELDEILPEHNEGLNVIPQILTNRADEFLSIAHQLSAYGYKTVNLNLGCPSGTVTAKKRGAGFLSVPDELDHFLEEIFDRCPLNISVKTRIGIYDFSEWEHLLSIYEKYPMAELIIHPRLQKELYAGSPHTGAYLAAYERFSKCKSPIPLCYNGDIVSKESLDSFLALAPYTTDIMIGRGILKKPNLVCELNGTPGISKEQLLAFHDDIYIEYQKRMSGEQPALFKMKELWAFLHECFLHSEKPLKRIRKSKHFKEYETAVQEIFSCELKNSF